MKKHLILLTVVLVSFSASLLAGGPKDLEITQTVPVTGMKATGVVQPIQCDAQSDVYAEVIQGMAPDSGTPILRISPDGGSRVFRAAPIAGQAAEIVSFSPEEDGGVALLAATLDRTKYQVQIIGATNTLESHWLLPAGIEPMQIAASPSGQLLIAGISEAQGGSAFTGIYDASGQLEREISLPNDISNLGVEDNLRPAGVPAEATAAYKSYRHALELSSASTLNNGAFMLTRITSGGPVYTLAQSATSPSGELQPNMPDGSALSSATQNENQIVLTSIKKKAGGNEISDVYITVWDPATSDEIAEFHSSNPALGAALACYQRGVFTFLNMGADSQLEMVRAIPSD